MRIGVLTGGGDCPGLNAVIRAVVRKGEGVLRPQDRRLPPRLARRDRGRDRRPHDRHDAAGCSTAAARSSARRARTRTSSDDGVAPRCSTRSSASASTR